MNENFKKDFWVFAKYIYLPKHIYTINTANLFIKSFKLFIESKVYNVLDSKIFNIDLNNRFLTDYYNVHHYFKFRFDSFLYFVLKYIGTFIARIRFTPRNYWLIKNKNLEKYLLMSKPWDILLTRWNWNASNITIPGFWKHMTMYIWTWKYLIQNYNNKHLKKLDKNKHYIVEAKWDGIKVVEFNELVSRNDYLWVSRTSFSDEKIKRTIGQSLNHVGKNYDFRFNYHSDSNLVCSELVLKSYAKEFSDDEWIDITLENLWLSLSFPPNNFIKLLKKEKKKWKKQ